MMTYFFSVFVSDESISNTAQLNAFNYYRPMSQAYNNKTIRITKKAPIFGSKTGAIHLELCTFVWRSSAASRYQKHEQDLKRGLLKCYIITESLT